MEEEVAEDGDNTTEEQEKDASRDDLKILNDASLSSVSFSNYPAYVRTYFDHTTKTNNVLVVASIPSGAVNGFIDVNDAGTEVTITFDWPKPLYQAEKLFKGTQQYHPKVIAMEDALRSMRAHINTAPKSCITLKLPIRVQTGSGTWNKSTVKDGDALVAVAEFAGYIADYAKIATKLDF